MTFELRGKRALVMGLGVHGGGLGVARWLAAQGAEVTVTDLRSAELLRSSIDALAGLPIEFVLGEHREEDFRRAELVVRNPGVPLSSRYLLLAREAGARIEMEMSLFFRACPAPIIAITGTKGKTTTTTLAGAMLRQQWPDTVVAGNLRVSALEQLDRITPATPVVLELSSWQLEGLGEAGLSPQFACVTNLSPDHLDRYGTMEEYGRAKQHIFLHQRPEDIVVLNEDDPIVSSWAALAPGRVAWFGAEQAAEWPTGPLRGDHNRLNIAAAATLARSYGASDEAIVAAIESFGGVEHRMEPVRELGGARYLNDTAATTPTAAAASLRAIEGPVLLIAGGANKNLSWAPLVEAVAAHPQRLALLLLAGTATADLAQALAEAGVGAPVAVYETFEAAILAARDQARPGDTVLLSPGAASFGMFRNEFHRGEEFRRIVGAL
ncbi:MAG TPA: UDP-N-acetylmuramoyl-L-alanine--D-glutamate ligase [Herpetosiphonaceae bacterium]